MDNLELELKEHLAEYPNCTETTCPHLINYVFMVIFEEPDNGFLGTARAFNDEQAKKVIRRGLAQTRPELHVKKLEIDLAENLRN